MIANPTYICVGHTFIDDIVFPTGKTCMAVLGGGGVHAAGGIRVWDERPGLVGAAGEDMPENARQRLKTEFDLQGITWMSVPQLRGWQLFEVDNRRTEVLRSAPQGLFKDDPAPEMCPVEYENASALTVLNGGAGLLKWRQRFPDAILLWEPNQPYMRAENRGEFCRALPFTDIVSPNLEEARALYGIMAPEALMHQMFDDGAQIVALRMGKTGSLVGQQGQSDILYVPAIPVAQITDQTGAGNAYCGGFLVGWNRTRDLYAAGCYGGVSASFALEQIGPIKAMERTSSQRDKRYSWLKDRIEVESLSL